MTDNTNFFLGIDLGTSGCKVCVIDSHQTIVAEGCATLPSLSQQKILHWQHALFDALNQIKPQSILSKIKGLSFDATSGTVFLCSSDAKQLSDILFYNDTRAEKLNSINNISKTNHANQNTSSLVKVLWLLQQQRPNSDFILMHQADFLLFLCTGNYGITDENNALKLGYDSQQQRWPLWIKKTLGKHLSVLPKIVSPGQFISKICPEFTLKTGLPKSVNVYAGTTDSIAACMATESYAIGNAITSLGSTMVLKIVSDKPIYNEHYGIYSHRYGHQWLVGGASNSGGAVLAQHFSPNEIKILSERIHAEMPSPLHYYPLPQAGERFPINDPDKKPLLEPHPADPVDFLHGLFEGIAQIEKKGYALL